MTVVIWDHAVLSLFWSQLMLLEGEGYMSSPTSHMYMHNPPCIGTDALQQLAYHIAYPLTDSIIYCDLCGQIHSFAMQYLLLRI